MSVREESGVRRIDESVRQALREMPESFFDTEATQAEVFHVCGYLEGLQIDPETLKKYQLTSSLLEKLKLMAAEPLDDYSQKKWEENIYPFVAPRLAKLIEHIHGLRDIRRCDAQALELLPQNMFAPAERLQIRQKLEALSYADPVKSQPLTQGDSTNKPLLEVLRLDQGDTISVITKTRASEGRVRLFKDKQPLGSDEKGSSSSWKLYRRVFDSRHGSWSWEVDQIHGKDAGKRTDEQIEEIKMRASIATSPAFREAVQKLLAKEVGISPEEVSYDNSAFNASEGVLPGDLTFREWANSRVDLLFGFRTVPLTGIREKVNGVDIASVQEALQTKEGALADSLTDKETSALFQRPPEEWEDILAHRGRVSQLRDRRSREMRLAGEPVRSIVRAGVMAYLMGDLDGTRNNCLVHPVTKQVKRIDTGMSLGLLTGKQVALKVPATLGSPKLVDHQVTEMIKSVPLELTLKHGLLLDSEAQAQVRDIYQRVRRGERERDYLLSIFRVVFQAYGEPIVRKQFEQFLDRLQDVAEHGRPTKLEMFKDYFPDLQMDALKNPLKAIASKAA